jgi:hypothetical protein
LAAAVSALVPTPFAYFLVKLWANRRGQNDGSTKLPRVVEQRGPHFNLSGEVMGEVTLEQVAHALKKLHKRQAAAAARQ